jgi:hypothetical protein
MFGRNKEVRKRCQEPFPTTNPGGAGGRRRKRFLTPFSRPFSRRTRSRRGVLLLVVLSLLVLFLMIGTAFILTAKQSQIASKSGNKAALNAARSGAFGELLDEVLLQLVRDTENPYSVIRNHSLLADMYGNDGFFGAVTDVRWAESSFGAGNNVTGGQMVQFRLDLSIDQSPTANGVQGVADVYGQPHTLSVLDGAYSGQVLTFIGRGAGANGRSARGASTRIVGYTPAGAGQGVFTVMAFPLADGSDLSTLGADLSSLNGSRILVNGRPFNGTGVGYIPDHPPSYEGAKLNAKEAVNNVAQELALMPNTVFFNPLTMRVINDESGISYFPNSVQNPVPFDTRFDYTGRGGGDESYDAPDFQNMALALLADEDFDDVQPPGGTLDNLVLPSFHRPELINYWQNQAPTPPRAGSDAAPAASLTPPLVSNPVMLRKVLLRPNWFDHPNFTGSNPNYATSLLALKQNPSDAQLQLDLLNRLIFGPWDVDNDNDGFRDSIWIDVGLPPMVGPNGELVKPLAAVLCVDLDGRVNVNVHDTLDLAGVIDDVEQEIRLAGNGESDETPRGAGWGVGDISLEPVLGDDAERLLIGAMVAGPGGNRFVPGRLGIDRGPGRSGVFDVMSQIDRSGWPQWGNQPGTLFGMPPDLRVRYGYGLNPFGQLVVEAALPSELNARPVGPGQGVAEDGRLTADSPYEAVNYPEGSDSDNGPLSVDAPFSLAELERVLRVYDADAGALPARLSPQPGSLPGFLQLPTLLQEGDLNVRLRITTDSWDLPTPNVALPHEMEPLLVLPMTLNPDTNQPYRRLPQSTAELFEIRVRAGLNRTDANQYPLFPVPLTGDVTDASTPAGRVRFIVRQILAPELAAGLRLNINRPFGNGLDDNNNGVVDEPGEDLVSTPRQVWRNSNDNAVIAPPVDQRFTSAPFQPLDANDDGVIDDTDAMMQRQLLARHLYTLALTLTAPTNFGATTPPSAADQALCRRLAQWAINIVDFRDADNIMTHFEYDLNPFDGWNVNGDPNQPIDGDLRTFDDHLGGDGQSSPTRPNTLVDDTYVWGAERPELVMTETISWHDRRTQDSISEDPYPPSDVAGPTDPNDRDFDPDYDQLVRPRGAFFVELYNPWSATPTANADTHEIRLQNGRAVDMGVDLRAVDDATGNSPVWRMTIYKRRTVQGRPVPYREVALWDPDERNTTTRTQIHRPNVPVDRTVYFTDFDPESRRNMWDDDGVAFFADPARPENVSSVRPGRYLVVGGGEDFDRDGVYESPVGDRTTNNPNANEAQPANQLRPGRRISLDTGNSPYKVRLMDNVDTVLNDPAGYAVQSPSENEAQRNGLMQAVDNFSSSVADVAVIDHVWDEADNYDDWPGAVPGSGERQLRRRALTLSEPARGYISRFRDAQWSDTSRRYRNPQSQSRAIDIPLDGPIGGDDVIENRVDDEGESVWSDAFPIPAYLNNIDPALGAVGELSRAGEDPRVSYATIFLQRLANPTLPWNPEPGKPGYDPDLQVNPYVTIDGMSSDLTVFNGRPQSSPPASNDGYEEDKLATDNGQGTNTNDARTTFASLERGFSGAARPAQAQQGPMPTLWRWQPPSRSLDNGRNPAVPRNRYVAQLSRTHVFRAPPFCTLGFLNTAFQDPGPGDPNNPASKQLRPRDPFPWLTWNNRPYASGNELMVVPRLSISRMLRQFTTEELVAAGGGNAQSPYDTPVGVQSPVAAGQGQQGQNQVVAFEQLENYFYDEEVNAQNPASGASAAGQPAHLYRVLEFIHTPSLFSGSKTWLNPQMFGAGGAAATYDDPRRNLGPPFNTVSQFRDPGRINLNTIRSEDVWNGLFHGEPSPDEDESHAGPDWDDFIQSRRGYGGDDDILALDPMSPTFFVNPFRSPDAAALVPLAGMVQRDGQNAEVKGVECTLLRSDDSQAGAVDDDPLFRGDTNQDYNNAQRNAFFRLAPMVRLDNLVTTRSNVYAVWVTIGFFEVEAAPTQAQFTNLNPGAPVQLYNRVYPDGYQFGKEAGLDEGDVKRLRGFYIIDRTRPAAFEPGMDHNVDQVIRLKRRIE